MADSDTDNAQLTYTAPPPDKQAPEPKPDADPFPTPTVDGTKTTYYGYGGDVDKDSASLAGKGDAGWEKRAQGPLVPHYSAALTKAQRAAFFPDAPNETSTGKEFEWNGKKYRDDDTAPEADKRVDIYAPDHPADAAGTKSYYSSRSEGGYWEGPPKSPPIQSIRDDHPELKDYSDEQILNAVKPKVAPDMSDDEFKAAAYSPQGSDLIKKSYESMTPLAQMRVEYPQFKAKGDDEFTKMLFDAMSKKGQLNGESLQAFRDKLSPPNNIQTWMGNFFAKLPNEGKGGDEWAGVLNDYQKAFDKAGAVLHESSAGMYGIPQSAIDTTKNIGGAIDETAKKFGINSHVKEGFGGFVQQWSKNPVGDFLKSSLKYLNNASAQQRAAAQAQQQKAKDLNPMLDVAASIAGQTPEMLSTFGLGGEAKGAQTGRMLWAALTQSMSQQGKQVEKTAKQQFMQNSRAGFTTAMQSLLFNSPYGRVATGLLNVVLGASDQDLSNWIEGRPNKIDEQALPAAINFGLGYLWGHDKINEASQTDIDAAKKATESGDHKTAQQMLDRANALMLEKEQQQHAQNFLSLIDLLSDNTLRGWQNIIDAQGYKPLTPEILKSKIEQAQGGTPEQMALAMQKIKPIQEKVMLNPEAMEDWQNTKDPILDEHPWDPSIRQTFADMVTEGSKEEPKASPLTKQDVRRFTNSYFYGHSPEEGAELSAGINPKVLKPLIDPVKGYAHKFHKVLDAGEYGPKAKEAEAEVGRANAQIQMGVASFLNQKYRELASPDKVQDLDLHSKRAAHFNKYTIEQQKAILMNVEVGNPTGDPIIDEMAKVRKQINAEFARVENAMGITYNLRDSYLMHAWKADKDTKEIWFKNHAKSFGDPSFMKPREIDTLAQGFSIGKELRSYSMEDLDQGRALDHFKAISKVDMLDAWHDQGDAYITTEDNIPEEAKQWQQIRSPKRNEKGTGTMYYVHPEKAIVIKRAWDPMFDNEAAQDVVGGAINALKKVKGFTVPIRLFSLAHAVHIPAIRFASRASHMIRDRMLAEPGEGAASWWKTLGDTVTGGVGQVTQDVMGKSDLVAAMQGQKDIRELSESDQWAVKQLIDSGFSAGFVDHHNNLMAQGIRQMMPSLKALGAFNKMTELGHKTLSKLDFQHFVFSKMIPSVKAAHILERISDLYRDRPELLDAKNNAERLQQLRAITQSADRKFGEMFYDNMFATKWVKNLGIGLFLSQAWQLGLVDYAGGLVDLGKNAFHMEKITQAAKQKGAGAAGREYLTDRLLMSYIYTGISMTTGAALTYLNMRTKPGGDKHQFTWMDMFFPWSGHNSDGTDKRYRTMNFPGELLSVGHHMQTEGVVQGLGHTLQNKYTGILASTLQAVYNVNYLGNKVSDQDLFDWNGGLDRLKYIFQNSVMPMGFEQDAKAFTAPKEHKAEATQDAVAAFLGFNQAPTWTGRTELDNKIIEARHKEKGSSSGQSVEQQKKWEKLDAIRDALNNGGHDDVKVAIKDALANGVSSKSIQNLEKTRSTRTGLTAFKTLSSEDQVKFLKDMKPEERKEYWKFAHEKAREEFNKANGRRN